MAIVTEKKSESTKIPFSIKNLSTVFCSTCQYYWCSLKGRVVFCSFRYKGIEYFSCEFKKCNLKKSS